MTVPGQKKITRPSGARAYWLNGVEGIALEAALADFIGHMGGARLVISKRCVRGQAHYTLELKKDTLKT
jgi:hypothetical protein